MQLSMDGIAVEYIPNSVDPGNTENKPKSHLYISDYNEKYACDSDARMIHL